MNCAIVQYYFMKCALNVFCFFILTTAAHGQFADTIPVSKLEDVIVKAYGGNKRLKDVAAPINYLNRNSIERFNNQSVVQAVNSLPGVRMEERSPGSFRFNIRGSGLRSPFGVRNVKVYFNDIPVTDPGGQTYLNQFGSYNYNSIEIIKGPASSLYGAGTGGAILIESSNRNEEKNITAEYSYGSYNAHNLNVAFTTGGKSNNKFSFQHQESDGYRIHSALKRNVFSWTGDHQLNNSATLKTTFLYGDLFYETPGALTFAEYTVNPRAARPPVGAFPGAETAKAAIYQKMFLAGASYTQQVTKNISNKTVVYGMFTDLKNPTIQNYGHSGEPHTGARTLFNLNTQLDSAKINFQLGGELQKGFSTVNIFKNVNGRADSLRTTDEINNNQSFMFSQASIDLKKWIITIGASLNFFKLNFERFTPAPLGKQEKKFRNNVAPRITIMRQFQNINLYGGISKGFSTPTTSELIPTGGDINLSLNAEQGVNYDAGIKASILKNIFLDINAFSFHLQNTIVQRRNAAGGDYFINAGSTKQKGIETAINYQLHGKKMQQTFIWLSHTYHNFHYQEFKQLTNDYSGNQLPSIAKHTLSAGLDITSKNGLLFTAGLYTSGKIPLNDANTAYADSYHILSLNTGYKFQGKHVNSKLKAGVENLLNESYSLGNDINGFNGRYYNIAPARNFYISIMLQFADL
jgi:iron complex outermembrane receptor protein